MRYDKEIYFEKLNPGKLNEETGNYDDEVVAVSILDWASIMNTSDDTKQLVYGNIKQQALTIQIQNVFDGAFDRIRFNGKYYRVDSERTLGIKQTFIVSEIQ